jgi:hypothetical protein
MKCMHVAIGLILLVFAMPSQSQTITGAQRAEIEKSVKDRIIQGTAALNSMNAEAFMQAWSRDKFIGQLTATGLEANLENIQKGIKTNFESTASYKAEVLDIRVDALSPELALAFCKMTERVEAKNGNVTNYNFANMMVWAKESGGWELIHVTDARQAKR